MNVCASPNQLYARLRSCQIASTPKSLAALQADLKSTRILQSQCRRFSGPVFERHHFPVFKRSIRTMATEVPKAEYRQLGKSGLRVSVPILGAMGIGMAGVMNNYTTLLMPLRGQEMAEMGH